VPRSYDGVDGLRAFVQPPRWPEIRTTYGYRNSRRDLDVRVPDVNTDGTLTIEGRFRAPGATLPGQLYCGFETRASQRGPLERAVVADGAETFDLSTLDLPDGVTLE